MHAITYRSQGQLKPQIANKIIESLSLNQSEASMFAGRYGNPTSCTPVINID